METTPEYHALTRYDYFAGAIIYYGVWKIEDKMLKSRSSLLVTTIHQRICPDHANRRHPSDSSTYTNCLPHDAPFLSFISVHTRRPDQTRQPPLSPGKSPKPPRPEQTKPDSTLKTPTDDVCSKNQAKNGEIIPAIPTGRPSKHQERRSRPSIEQNTCYSVFIVVVIVVVVVAVFIVVAENKKSLSAIFSQPGTLEKCRQRRATLSPLVVLGI